MSKYYINGKAKNTESFKREILEKVGEDFHVLGEYINNRTKIKIRHNTCGHIFNILPISFLLGKSCPKCRKNKKLKTTKIFKDELYKKYKNEYSVLEEYVGARTKIKIKHNNCGTIWEITPDNILRGYGCPKCGRIKSDKKRLLNYDYIKKYIEVISMSGCKLISKKYKTFHEKLEIQCSCGRIFKKSFAKFKSDSQQKCTICSCISKGENKILDFLENKKCEYRREYTFDDCYYINKLRFDFAVFKNNKLFCLIEFDGKHHFEPISFSKKTSQQEKNMYFIDVLIRDNIKNDYCIKNKIKLIRIPYFNIRTTHNILNEKLVDVI